MRFVTLTLFCILLVAALAVRNSSSEPDTLLKRMLRLLTDTNTTVINQTILPPSKTYTSVASTSQNESIKSWENWRLKQSRMAYEPNVPNRYSPQNSDYEGSIYWNTTSLLFVVAGVVFMVIFIAFIIGRFCLNFAFLGAGRAGKKKKMGRCLKHTPTAIGAFGFLIFFISTILQLVGVNIYNSNINSNADYALLQGSSFYNDALELVAKINQANTSNLTYDADDNTTKTWYVRGVDDDDVGDDHIKSWLETLVNQTKNNKDGSSKLSEELRDSKSIVTASLWLFFASGLVSAILSVLAYRKQQSTIVLTLGLFVFILISLCWIFDASFVRNALYTSDICYDVEELLKKNASSPPNITSGLSYYLNCFDNDGQKDLGTVREKLTESLVIGLDVWRDKANKTTGSNYTTVNAVVSINDVDALLLSSPYENSTELNSWASLVLKPTYEAMEILTDFKDCKYVRKWAVNAEITLCTEGLDKNWIGFVGCVMMAFAFIFMAFGLILAKNIFDRLRSQKENMISRSDLNLEL